jgi:hypothetical protein
LNFPDISQCPDCVTFSPAIKDNEEMHLMLQFTVLMKAGQGPIPKQNAVDYVAGYTLVVSSAVRIAGDTSDPGPDYQGKSTRNTHLINTLTKQGSTRFVLSARCL